MALAAARTKLMAVAGIRELSFDYDSCPPNARCPGPTGDEGEVIATLPTGEQLSVIVRVGVDGIVRAEEPVPVAGIEGVVER